ncbi:maestro heat-like repeat-containing protein family member 1 isoform X2 [Patiria miniata]|uniref:Maestro heat-like repeat-containing protein family member 1 n=1 Tax=Patiria miniata TaxID=46514 RepID=A0A914AVM7_PATMI|nr:maestro heat-like repeat-containing protein family member 1 isoform X2 [Patiria miniata]
MIMPLPGEDEGFSTGGQIDAMVMAMIDTAYDKNMGVRTIIATSLVNIGKKKPGLVLHSCHNYLRKHSKLQRDHRVVILQTMERILKETLDRVPLPLIPDLVKLASDELTATKDTIEKLAMLWKDKATKNLGEVQPEWQTAASGVLVALGHKYCNEVMEELVRKFQPGTLPHFFVVQTMANLATANSFGFVPFLTATLGTLLPMLGMAKQDNMKWVCVHALARFSESIEDYVANIENAPDSTINKATYSTQIFTAFDHIFNAWQQSKEAKLRLMVVEALGHMSKIILQERLEEQVPKLIPTILNMYKKHPEPFFITQGLCMILESAVANGSTMLEAQLETILNTLHAQVCVPPDFNHPLTMKNHNEVLRCFAVVARSFSDRVVAYLLQKLEGNERIRIGTLGVFKQLINSNGPHMDNKKSLVLSGLRIILADQSNKVKKIFAQVVIAMAHHGYLELEGGNLMIEFVVKQCALQPNDVVQTSKKEKVDPDPVNSAALRAMCDNVIHLITTTVVDMESVLWPFLLEFIVQPQYTDAMGTLCQSLAFIGAKKRDEETDDYKLLYEELSSLPKPNILVARLMVMAGRPDNGRKRGIHVLKLMLAMSPNIHDAVVDMWDAVIPKLIQYIEENLDDEDKWSQKSWEDLLLKLLSKTLDVVEEEEWHCDIGAALGDHIPLYQEMPEEKNFLYKCLGVVMRKVKNTQFVQKHLDIMFSSVRHNNHLEREGCAYGLGFCASSHLDIALAKLESVTKMDMARKSTGFFGLVKDKTEADVERIKSTVMLCYGYLTLFAPSDIIASRVEANILRNINPHFAHVKDTAVKQNLIRAVDLIGKALHPDHLKRNYSFSKKTELLNHMLSYMKTESTKELHNETRSLAMQSCATLVKLEPHLNDADTFDLIKVSVECMFKLPVGLLVPGKGKEEVKEEQVRQNESLVKTSFSSLHDLLSEILRKDLTPQGFLNVFKHLEPWMVSVQDHERQRSVTATLILLKFYLNNVTDMSAGSGSFTNMGTLIGRLVPRCSDPDLTVRENTVQAIQIILRIDLLYQGKTASFQDPVIEALTVIRERAAQTDPNVLYSLVNDLSKALAKKIPSEQLKPFIYMLIEGLLDVQSHCSSGACVVLNTMLKTRGTELVVDVDEMIGAIHFKLINISYQQTRTGTLRAVRTLASNHLSNVVDTLLKYPLPYDAHIQDCWKSLASDPVILKHLFDSFMDTLTRNVHYEEKIDHKTKKTISKTANVSPLTIVHALIEILAVEETEASLRDQFHRIFATLLIYVGSCVGVRPPNPPESVTKDGASGKDKKAMTKAYAAIKPSVVAVNALKALILRGQGSELIQFLESEGVWDMLQDTDKYQDGVSILAQGMAKHMTGYISKIVSCLIPTLASLYEPQRVVTAAFLAELVNQKCAGDMQLVEDIMNNLLGRMVDSCHVVRMLCIRGMGNVASLGPQQTQKYCTTVLSAMMAGMDDKEDTDDQILLESMTGLSRILVKIDESNIRPILVNIALRIRPCFEKDRATVRAVSFTLFGNLSRFGDGPSKPPFLEQIHTNFVSLLLHLNDEDEDVKKACKFTLREVGPLIGSESLNKMFQKHLLDEGSLNYGEFMFNLSKVIISDFLQKVNFYVMANVGFFKSSWPDIRGNAAMFVGFLLGNLPEASHTLITKEHVCGALILLLKDPDAAVRIKASEAMSLLPEY